ncbi:hypothetical protein [Mariprofundus ferrooxydans]|nr:hypothetical protein [Mariprofundus ferrooxydans]KON46603.1 hypothetical protein AL013_12490 [Mariprofundus ferrooxydans]
MYRLGIDPSKGWVFEDESVVWPTPVMSVAKFLGAAGKEVASSGLNREAPYYFREDSFDLVSRVRRGRFYKATGQSGGPWRVYPHPMVTFPHFQQDSDGAYKASGLTHYEPWKMSREFERQQVAEVLVRLGDDTASTLWQVIHLETGFTGEEIVMLKARQSFGALPAVDWSKVPESAVSAVREKLDTLEDEFHRAGVESVVDRAREAATAILSAYLQKEDIAKAKGEDLSKLVGLLVDYSGKHGRRVVACAGEIAARLHSRGKHAEQEARGVRELREQDAQLAVQCVGVILCDLGWAEWK